MPPGSDPTREKSLQEIVDEVNRYPIEAFLFLQQALGYAVNLVHAELSEVPDANVSRHITGQQLCEGLRAYALAQWGITSTLDFGRIVFALVDAGHMAKTDTDTIEDFRDVYDFQTAFDSSYQIGSAL
jgi:uncharacterized repeat protein (TIGR04138 family)